MQTAHKLNSEQIEILRHTAHRAPGGRFCGDGPDIRELVRLGLMQYLGRSAWCPDPFFGLTDAGRECLRALHNG